MGNNRGKYQEPWKPLSTCISIYNIAYIHMFAMP